MSKMTVIQILNKIANEEVRHDIKINTRYYYCSIEEYLKRFGVNEDSLNFEVIGFDDIIEEDKKIEKLVGVDKGVCIDYNMCDIVGKINEIIDKINEEK